MTTQLSSILADWTLRVFAHIDGLNTPGPRNWSELSRAWEWEPVVMFALLAVALLYRRGVRRLWVQSGAGRGLRRWEVAAFWAGWWTLVTALVSPLHPWGKVLFS